MILTVTSNVALDRTYIVDHVELGAVHKVRTAFAQTGGKGVNVSRTLAALGCATAVTGLIGRAGFAEAQPELEAAGLAPSLYAVDGPPRHTVTVTSRDDGTTAFYEPGPTVTGDEWQGFEDHVRGLLAGADMVVIAGSLPPGAPPTHWSVWWRPPTLWTCRCSSTPVAQPCRPHSAADRPLPSSTATSSVRRSVANASATGT